MCTIVCLVCQQKYEFQHSNCHSPDRHFSNSWNWARWYCFNFRRWGAGTCKSHIHAIWPYFHVYLARGNYISTYELSTNNIPYRILCFSLWTNLILGAEEITPSTHRHLFHSRNICPLLFLTIFLMKQVPAPQRLKLKQYHVLLMLPALL
jgi:hypothetical protein